MHIFEVSSWAYTYIWHRVWNRLLLPFFCEFEFPKLTQTSLAANTLLFYIVNAAHNWLQISRYPCYQNTRPNTKQPVETDVDLPLFAITNSFFPNFFFFFHLLIIPLSSSGSPRLLPAGNPGARSFPHQNNARERIARSHAAGTWPHANVRGDVQDAHGTCPWNYLLQLECGCQKRPHCEGESILEFEDSYFRLHLSLNRFNFQC